MEPLEEYTVLKFASADMDLAADVADALSHADELDVVRRLSMQLETAMVVIYARPFGSNDLGKLPAQFHTPPAGFVDYHADLLRRRHKLYAHTDPDGGHTLDDLRVMLGLAFESAIGDGASRYAESMSVLDRSALRHILHLCIKQKARFEERLGELAPRVQI